MLSKNATQGEVLRQTFLHELTHMAEKSDLYGDLMDSMLTLKYGDDYANSDQYKADFGSMRDLYARNGEDLNDTEVNEELTAEAAWDILFPTLEDAQKLTENNPSLVRRVLNWIEDMLNRVRGINDPEVERLKQARELYRQCLETVEQANDVESLQNRLVDESTIPFIDQVQDVLSKNGHRIVKSSDALNLGASGNMYSLFGMQDKPIGLRQSILKKIVGHGLSDSQAKMLSDEVKRPVAIFDNPKRNCVYVVTSLKVNESPVIAIVNKNIVTGNGEDIHGLISAYPMRDFIQYLQDHVEDGAKFIVNEKKAFDEAIKLSEHTMDRSFDITEGLINKLPQGFSKVNTQDEISNRFITPEQDAEYMKAVESGDTETQQRMVDEVAKQIMAQSKIRDEEGKLLKVYHGTDTEFNTFDMSKGRANMDIQGSFFSPWDIDAGGYGPNVRAFYLDIKNPAPEAVAYRALHKYAGQNGAGIKARQDLIRVGYDGVNNGDEEYIAFFPGQIKSADITTYDDNGNVIPLSERFNEENNDIRYRLTDQSTLPSDEVLDRMLREWIAGREGNAVQASANAAPAMQAMKANIAVTQTSRQRRGRKPANIKSGDTIIREWRKAIGIDRNGNAYGKHPYLTAGKRKKRGATRAFLRQMYFRFPDWYRSFPGYGVITPE